MGMESQSLDSLKNNYKGNFMGESGKSKEGIPFEEFSSNELKQKREEEEFKILERQTSQIHQTSRFSQYMQQIHGNGEVKTQEGSLRLKAVSIYKIRNFY